MGIIGFLCKSLKYNSTLCFIRDMKWVNSSCELTLKKILNFWRRGDVGWGLLYDWVFWRFILQFFTLMVEFTDPG